MGGPASGFGIAASVAILLLGCAPAQQQDSPGTISSATHAPSQFASVPGRLPTQLPAPPPVPSTRQPTRQASTLAPVTTSVPRQQPTYASLPTRPVTAPAPATSPPTSAPRPASPTGPAASPPTSVSTPPVVTTPPPSTISPAACQLPDAWLGTDLESLDTDEMVVALTFDGGGSNAGVAAVLDTLAATGTPASFFLTGQFAQRYPADAAEIASRYPIGNHSMTHPNFTELSDEQAVAELDQAREAITAATGQDPVPWFRFPSGDRDARTISLVNSECYVPFRWTVDSLGWQGSEKMSRQAVIDRVVGQVRPGAIVLMHVGANPDDQTTFDADALPAIIEALTGQGYRFVTLDHAVDSAP